MIEYLNSEYIFKNLIPELVEKKEPPIITKIKKTKDRLDVLSLKENPILNLVNKIPKHLEEEALTRIELLIKGWEWQYRDSTTAYAGE